jgi:hypothetical protein
MAIEDEMMGVGAKSASFEKVGDSVEGTICGELERKQQTNIDTGELEYHKSGDPKWVYLLPLATNERDGEDDDGTRTLWANYLLQKEIARAVKAAGAKRPEKGGYLRVTCVELRPTKFPTKQKIYSAEYTPAAANSFMAEEKVPEPATPAATVPAAPKPAVPAPVADNAALAAAMASLSDEQKKALGLV